MDGSVLFNTNLLQTSHIITNRIRHLSGPDLTVGLVPVANANKSAITSMDSAFRIIQLMGVIKGDNPIDLAQRIDAFKGYFRGKEKNLDINYAGSTRRYIATKNKPIDFDYDGDLPWADFTVELVCTEPFGLDTTPTVLFDVEGYTSGTYTATPTIEGTADYQLFKFIFTINSLTGTGDYVQFSNNANNQAITIYGQALEAGDVIVIDCVKKIVTLNDVVIDYSGTFFEVEPGPASISYTDGFTTRNVDIYGEYIKRYE